MGLISKLLGVGQAVQNAGEAIETVSEVFTVNKTKAEVAARAQAMASLTQYGAEFRSPQTGWFNGFINGINRLPRPIIALGTVGLFAFAMADPVGFATRIQDHAYVPDPLWWLLGAVVPFYFGARELHYAHESTRAAVIPSPLASNDPTQPTQIATLNAFADNTALAEWLMLTKMVV
ncbi:MAG: holin family protein [Paracoccaceae bacterium]